MGTHFFVPDEGGNALLYQHVFWFFGHPEVYVMILPAMGIISGGLPVFARKPVFGYTAIALATAGIAIISMFVWAHHMFATGIPIGLQAFFMISSMFVAVPTGVKIFNWLATTWRGNLIFSTAMLFALGFIAVFTLGGLSGIFLAVFPFDWDVHDTYYVVAHLHYVLFGGSIFGIFAGLYYWWPKMFGRLLDERIGKWQFWLTFIGFNITFFPRSTCSDCSNAAAGLHVRPWRIVGGLQPRLEHRIGDHGHRHPALLRQRARDAATCGRRTTRGWPIPSSGTRPRRRLRELRAPVPYVTSSRPLRDIRRRLKEMRHL